MENISYDIEYTQHNNFIMIGEYFIENYDKFNLTDYLYPDDVDDEKKIQISQWKNIISSEELYFINQKLINDYNNILILVKENCKDSISNEIIYHLKNLRFKYEELNCLLINKSTEN